MCALFENRARHLRRSGMDDSEAHSMLIWTVRFKIPAATRLKEGVSRSTSGSGTLSVCLHSTGDGSISSRATPTDRELLRPTLWSRR